MHKYSHGTYFYRKDAQGNIIALLDSNGNVVVRYVYDAWGNHAVLGTDGNDISDANHIGILNPFRYRGYFYDEETGLYYLKTRYYDPETGRFITIDDISYIDPETINGLNLYAYCGNNPVMNVDPTGTFFLMALLIGLIAGAVIGGAVNGVIAYNNGARGWELVGQIALGAVVGGVIGAAAGAVVGVGGAIMGMGANLLGMGLSGGGLALANGMVLGAGATALVGVAGVAVGGVVVIGGAAVALVGLNVLLAQWVPGSWPGDDPSIPPGDGFEWRGPGKVGSEFGEWYNSITGDQLHPDLDHLPPKGPHWGWRNKIKRIFIDIFKR